MFLSWTNTHSINVKKLDDQHKKLVELTNRLFDLIDKTPESRDQDVSTLLGDTIIFAKEHFQTEENLMEKHKYPDIRSQKEDHNDLRERLEEIQKRYRDEELFSEKNTGVVLEFLEVIKDWLLNHMMEKDVKMGEFLNSKGVF